MATRRPDRTAMNSAPLEADDAAEQLRLDALLALDALDSPREEAFERIARLVRNVFDLPVALVSVIDAHRRWYKSCDGLSADEVERKETFCRYTITAREVVVVEDASRDPALQAIAMSSTSPSSASMPACRWRPMTGSMSAHSAPSAISRAASPTASARSWSIWPRWRWTNSN